MITEADIHRFTKGDCHILAKRLHRIAGLSLHCIVTADGKHTRHAFVMHKGRVLDVLGLQTVNQFIGHWKYSDEDEDKISISKPLTLKWFRYNWRPLRTTFGNYSYFRARKIAKHLVETYC